ncbi:microtubule associated [Pyrenophora seminiperda CCB06]|uniref:Microtubule associated n=1 Tax=Pyrenophora seminiperda CCB06 TaxID=1302712 RepID=A0A3M7M8R1_9PLEO|nr:microtubule associated [Pyrenophora seminiperda CCB06]
MVASPSAPGAFARRVVNPLGFNKTYNFWLYIIFGGALAGFSLARLNYLDFYGTFCPATGGNENWNSAAPGECYYYLKSDRYRIGIIMHLAGVLPAGLIAVSQFTPFIRRRWMIVHRIGGYVSLLLYLVGMIGAFMIARHSFGGGLDIQSWVWVAGFATLGCFIISYINIKRLQIEQHRAWMLRGWFYAGSIVTSRLIVVIGAIIVVEQDYYITWPCAKIAATIVEEVDLVSLYPTCKSFIDGSDPEAVASVAAKLFGGNAANTGAALNIVFGMALWVSLAIHAFGVEVYLHLTPKEAHRLREISYQKQLEAGMRSPGSAGLTADRLGDADKWVPKVPKRENMNTSLTIETEPKRMVKNE